MSIPPRTDHHRQHHYQFAHRFLPITLHKPLAEPIRQFGLDLVHRFLDDMLLSIWHDVGAALPPEQRIEPVGLRAVHDPDPLVPMMLVVMPPARHMAEAHFAAIVVEDGAVRYFVLEESWSPERTDATVIGEWTQDGSHVNYGPGPVASLAPFRDAIHMMLAPPG